MGRNVCRCLAVWLGLLLMLMLGSCSGTDRGVTVSANTTAFGTVLTLKVTGPTRADADRTVALLLEETARLEDVFSYSDPDSELSRLNREAYGKAVAVGKDLYAVIDRALEICDRSGGALDIALGDLIELWHVETNEGEVPEIREEYLRERPTYRDVTLDGAARTVRYEREGLKIHLGAVAKGYLCEVLRDVVKEQNCTGILNLGGSIQTVGRKAGGGEWKIGVADPERPDASVASFPVGEASVATSGSYQRYFEADGVRYHHILDPKTGCPSASGLVSVTVTGPDGLVCDALSTACFVLGRKDAELLMGRYPDYGALFIEDTGEDRTLTGCGSLEGVS